MRATLRSAASTPRSRRVARVLALGAAAGVLLLSAAVPAVAKEYLEARLEAPISFQSPPGAELEVAVLVTIPDGVEIHPVDGSPIWLRLIGRAGDATEAPGRMGSGPGRYVMRITVPEGGPRRLEVVMRGTSDLPIFLTEDPFTFRPIGPGTAQLAPTLADATPGGPAAVVATPVANAAVEPAPAADPAAVPVAASEPGPSPVAPAVAVAAVVAALGALAVAGRLRSRRRSPQGT